MLQLYLLKHSYQSKYLTLELGKNFFETVFYVCFLEYQSFSYVTGFWLCFCDSIKGETMRIAAVYQLRKTEEDAFRLLCSETD